MAFQASYAPGTSPGHFEINIAGDWVELKGIETGGLTGGARSESDYETVDGGVQTSVGSIGAKDLELTVSPAHGMRGYRYIVDAGYYGQRVIQCRMRTEESVVIDNANTNITMAVTAIDQDSRIGRLAVAGSAAANADLTGPAYPYGIGLAFGADAATHRLFALESVTSATAGSVRFVAGASFANVGALATGIAATNAWELVRYGVGFEWSMNVLGAGDANFEPGGRVGDSITMKQTAADLTMAFAFQGDLFDKRIALL